MKEKKTILFLMSDTGGGHRASAEAIAAAVEYLYPAQYELLIEDIFKRHTPWPFNKIPNSYSWITLKALPLWKLLWATQRSSRYHDAIFTLLAPFVRRQVAAYLQQVDPDLIVSVHPLMNHLGLDWLRHAQLNVPFVTVVTDMVTFHPTWICPRVTRCIVPTKPAFERALSFGMPKEKLAVYGQPIHLKFAKTSDDKRTVRQELGLQTGRDTVLIMGGGEGYGKLFDIARNVAQHAPDVQMVVVCGRNSQLKAQLEAIKWEIPTRILGFVDNMPDLMRAADLLISKAGPGTLSEAFVTGLPALISGYIPGQESGNVQYVAENGAGAYADCPQAIGSLVAEWFAPGNRALDNMASNANRLARPQASIDIATDVLQLLV